MSNIPPWSNVSRYPDTQLFVSTTQTYCLFLCQKMIDYNRSKLRCLLSIKSRGFTKSLLNCQRVTWTTWRVKWYRLNAFIKYGFEETLSRVVQQEKSDTRGSLSLFCPVVVVFDFLILKLCSFFDIALYVLRLSSLLRPAFPFAARAMRTPRTISRPPGPFHLVPLIFYLMYTLLFFCPLFSYLL